MTDFNNFNYREINATQSNFIGFVSNGKIYNSFNQQIGVTNEEYKKAIDTAKDYEQILYDKGILEKPKNATKKTYIAKHYWQRLLFAPMLC